MKALINFSKGYLFMMIASILFPLAVSAQWGPDIRLSAHSISAALNENAGPCLAVSGDSVHVVWSDKRTHGYAIYYKHSFDTGLTWNTEIPITDTFGKATMPVIAVSGSTVHVVWMDSILDHRASFYKRSLDGGFTWGPKFCLDSNTKFWPGVTVSGSFVVATLNKEYVTGNTEVFIMRSMNNGTTWGPEQRISNANGRSEDPAIAINGSCVHLVWNDNRNTTMEIYYRRSKDYGVTWGPETQLTTTDSYSSMVSLDGPDVDVPFGINTAGNFDVWLRQSSDTGSTFGIARQLTNFASAEAYPFLVRDHLNLHMTYYQLNKGAGYLHSADGGATWDSAISLTSGSQAFIAITGCVLHVIWSDGIYPAPGAIYYKRNPTGNCKIAPVGIQSQNNIQQNVRVYPNPFSKQTTIEISSMENSKNTALIVYDLLGQIIINKSFGDERKVIISNDKLNKGVYFYKVIQKDIIIATGKIMAE